MPSATDYLCWYKKKLSLLAEEGREVCLQTSEGVHVYKSTEQRVQITEYSPITKLCFVIAFSPFGRRTSFPNRREESLVILNECEESFVISSVGEKSLNSIPWHILPLICYCAFFLLLLVPHFLTQKVPKTSAHGNSSQSLFCSGIAEAIYFSQRDFAD